MEKTIQDAKTLSIQVYPENGRISNLGCLAGFKCIPWINKNPAEFNPAGFQHAMHAPVINVQQAITTLISQVFLQ
jgi:hypothetical protein